MNGDMDYQGRGYILSADQEPREVRKHLNRGANHKFGYGYFGVHSQRKLS